MAKARLELGNTPNIKWFEGIGEYKIDWGPGYRIYLAQDGKSLIVLFGGRTKKKQQADIDRAKELFKVIKVTPSMTPATIENRMHTHYVEGQDQSSF